MSEKIEPALTLEEWAAFREGELHTTRPHATAALCLHGKPFGFTWEMLDALRDAVKCARQPHNYPLAMKAVGLVEALLAPRAKP